VEHKCITVAPPVSTLGRLAYSHDEHVSVVTLRKREVRVDRANTKPETVALTEPVGGIAVTRRGEVPVR
jgi:hypothetical protein